MAIFAWTRSRSLFPIRLYSAFMSASMEWILSTFSSRTDKSLSSRAGNATVGCNATAGSFWGAGSKQTITATRYATDKIELTIFFALEPVGLGLFIMASTNATTASGNKNRYIPPRDANPTKSPVKIKSVSKIAIFYSIVVKSIRHTQGNSTGSSSSFDRARFEATLTMAKFR